MILKNNFNKIQFLLLIFLFGFIAWNVFNYSRTSPSAVSTSSNQFLNNKYPGPKNEMTGMNYEIYHRGQKAISIKADRFRTQKKKIGFFRFGLMNEAKFENVNIKLYRGKFNDKESAEYQFADFEEVFKENKFTPVKKRRYTSIIMTPVFLEIYNDDSIATSISAGLCKIKIKEMIMEFSDNVMVKSGERTLTTNKLKAFLKTSRITASDNYSLEASNEFLKGKRITTDIFLKPV